MSLRTRVTEAWQRLAGVDAAAGDAGRGERKTIMLPSILTPYGQNRVGQNATPKPTPANLRKFAETPVARRAINVVKDKIASMDWKIKVRRGYSGVEVPDAAARMQVLRCCLEEPNISDSFRTLFEQVLEDLLVGGFGSVEMEATGDSERPFHLWAVDGATIEIDVTWDGDPAKPRYAQATSGLSRKNLIPLLDDELMYIRLNPRSHTPFGLGRLEVAFETVNQFLSANRYAGRVARRDGGGADPNRAAQGRCAHYRRGARDARPAQARHGGRALSFGIQFLTIDNLDGRGAVDYSAAISADAPFTIERVLNAPSRCTGALVVNAPGLSPALPVPVRRARIVVAAAGGTILFTGYLATEPVPVYVGVGLAGPVYRVTFTAISDEWLLDKLSLVLTNNGYSVAGGTLLSTLAARTGAGLLTTSGVVVDKALGVFTPEPAKPWSANAGLIAGSTYAAYRALNGALSTQTVGATTHALNFDEGEGEGTLQPAALRTAMVKELANDVTLAGLIEPSAYAQEIFAGDGTTTLFQLSDEPFRISKPTLLVDSFNQAAFDTQLWNITDPGSHLFLGGGGLTLTGGAGYDGQTTLVAADQVELGGTLVLEAANVQLASPSDGVLLGLYAGPVQRANCLAGYNIRQSGDATVLTPYVDGTEVGTSYTLLSGHAYTLRIRVHSPEMQRVLQVYYARVDGVIESFGGGLVTSPISLVFDLIDLGDASNTPATILYDSAAAGSVSSSPANCTFAVMDNVQLTGSIGSCAVTQTSSAWVVSTLPGGATETRLIGIAGEGVDCKISATGLITFFAGRIPVAGELVTVFYRTRDRAVARLEDSASIAAEAAAGFPGTTRWLGKVLHPPARSSVDCESVALAVLALATSRSAALAGSYAAINPAADIWPGDVLAITANGETLNVVVRKVDITGGHSVPELLSYKVTFANDWAESLGLTLSEAIPPDAYLPPAALPTPALTLSNLQQLAVTSATTTALTIDAGTDPPPGGGFEVRLRDFDFGPGVDQNLVLRSPVRGFSIPRSAQVERYFVRMYDASTPPLYSRLSSAVFTNLPVS